MGVTAEQYFEGIHNTPPFEYLPYNRVGLRTEQMSEVDVNDVDIRSRVSTNCWLPNPIIAAAMNSISEDEMAIAMALSGGAAFIHHANTPEEQKLLARNVYHYFAGVITKPFTAKEDETLRQVQERLGKIKKDFQTIPVKDENSRCSGLLDKTIFKLYEQEPETLVKDAMHPRGTFATDDSGLNVNEVYDVMKRDKLDKLVLLNKERRIGGLCLVNNITRVAHSNRNEFSLHEEGPLKGRLIAFASVPTILEEAIERIRLLKKYIKVFGIDTSHGEHKYAVETLEGLKEEFSDVDIIAGNISTEQTAIQIANYEPDGIQVGQGPGGICSSSDRLGIGTPQASAVYEVTKGVGSVNPEIPIIADGGIKEPADTVKAFAIGATAVKVGGLVAGTEETPVPIDRDDETGALFRLYWGMGSKRAQEAFAAARARYGHYGPKRKLIFIEGFEKKVPLKGSVRDVIEEHVLGIKISMGAQGTSNIVDLQEKARFMSGNNSKAA